MYGLDPLTRQCAYSTPCGWCAKWDKKCDNKISGVNEEPLKPKAPCYKCESYEYGDPKCPTCKKENYRFFEEKRRT